MAHSPVPPALPIPERRRENLRQQRAPGFGLPCPDAGYALFLAHLTESELALAAGEQPIDARWSVATVAMRRAGAFGRAPHIGDIRFACALLAYDQPESNDFAHWRYVWLRGIAENAVIRQWLADTIPVELTRHLDAETIQRWRHSLNTGAFASASRIGRA